MEYDRVTGRGRAPLIATTWNKLCPPPHLA